MLVSRAKLIRLIAFDVDGVMTDGGLFLSDSGEEFKRFNSLDGHGLKMLIASGVDVALITGRTSRCVEARAKNLGITHVFQGVENKLAVMVKLLDTLKLSRDAAAFMGDDVVDLTVMRHVGLAISVPDAPLLVRENSDYVTQRSGGNGAVRELCELVMSAQGTLDEQLAPYLKMSIATRVRYWLMPLPLLGLLGLSYWLNQQVQMEPAKPDSSKRHDPDAIVENFSATRLNTQGTPHFIMTAKKMLHFPDDDSTTLETPRITSLYPERSSIHAKADRGIITSDGETIFLRGDVEILREASTRQGALTLNTDSLRVLPDVELMDTDKKVTVVEAHNTIYATGLQMDNKARTIKLLSQVRSEYAPPNQ